MILIISDDLAAFICAIFFIAWALWILKTSKISERKKPTLKEITKELRKTGNKGEKIILGFIAYALISVKTFTTIVWLSIIGIIGLCIKLFADNWISRDCCKTYRNHYVKLT